MDFGMSLRGIWKGFGGSSRPCRETPKITVENVPRPLRFEGIWKDLRRNWGRISKAFRRGLRQHRERAEAVEFERDLVGISNEFRKILMLI